MLIDSAQAVAAGCGCWLTPALQYDGVCTSSISRARSYVTVCYNLKTIIAVISVTLIKLKYLWQDLFSSVCVWYILFVRKFCYGMNTFQLLVYSPRFSSKGSYMREWPKVHYPSMMWIKMCAAGELYVIWWDGEE